MFSITYRNHSNRFGSIWFQNLNRAHRDLSQTHTQKRSCQVRTLCAGLKRPRREGEM
jgi:hypothetical protein